MSASDATAHPAEVAANAGDGRDFPLRKEARGGAYAGQVIDGGLSKAARVAFGPDGRPRAVTYMADAASEMTTLAALTKDGRMVLAQSNDEGGLQITVLDREMHRLPTHDRRQKPAGNGSVAITYSEASRTAAAVVVGDTTITFVIDDSGDALIRLVEEPEREEPLPGSSSSAEPGRPLPGAKPPFMLELEPDRSQEERGFPIYGNADLPDGGYRTWAQTPSGAGECVFKVDGTTSVAGRWPGGPWFEYTRADGSAGDLGSFTLGKGAAVDVSALAGSNERPGADAGWQADASAGRVNLTSLDGFRVAVLAGADGKHHVSLRDPERQEGLNLVVAPDGTAEVHAWYAGRIGKYREDTPLILRGGRRPSE